MVGGPTQLSPQSVSVQLIDSSTGALMQTWEFDGQDRITVGRAGEQDIRVGDQYVSRLHAELQCGPDGWILIAQGRNGVHIDGQRIDRARLADRTVFRLGPNGPALCFRYGQAVDALATIAEELAPQIEFRIDQAKCASEVAEIIDGGYFRDLETLAAQLREQRSEDSRRG